jgi:hypothetical protein
MLPITAIVIYTSIKSRERQEHTGASSVANGITIIAQVVLGGFFGGLVFALIRDLIWRRLTRPKLSFTDSYTTDFETNDDGEITKQVFRIPVKNTGQSAATNCKPELTMEGRLNIRSTRWTNDSHGMKGATLRGS